MVSLRAMLARLWSYRKQTWEPSDYPINYREIDGQISASPIKWPMIIGLGPDRETARANLLEHLQDRIDLGSPMPRPGTNGPIEFASTSGIDTHGDRAYHLIEELFGIQPIFISDESQLSEFAHDEESFDRAVIDLSDRYGLDVTYIEDRTVLELLDDIYKRGTK